MTRSAKDPTGVALLVLLCAALAGCPRAPESGEAAEKAQEAYELYARRPDTDTYENFIKANRTAAGAHDNPHDEAGVEYQARALETMAAEAERAKDLALAHDVVERIDEIERQGHLDTYDEVSAGAKARLIAARARARAIIP